MKYIRENIITLKENYPHEFGKFIMALKNLEDSDDWFRICGIHGNSFKPNDPDVLCPTDADVVTKIAKTGEPFYCAHSVEPFISWHVPYINEFEKLLNIYNKSQDKTYITLPYFDITQQNYDYTFLNSPEITILYDNKNITIRNPLASAYYYLNGIKTNTIRNGYIKATTNKELKQIKTIRSQLYNTLHAKTYEEFSSQLVSNLKTYKPYNYVPLETPHNSIHNIIGGDGGNMSDISIAAFDPIFWLHHCNMDRFYYNWLVINNDTKQKFTKKSLEAFLPPFSDNITFGWRNNTNNFLQLKNIISLDQYQYTYNFIALKKYETQNAYINLIDIPIPRESIMIYAYVYPKTEIITQQNKDLWYAGFVSWFGINRDTQYCSRCQHVRTNLKIDILDFVISQGINKDNLSNYNILIEADGKLIKNIDTYKKYSSDEIIKDGLIDITINL